MTIGSILCLQNS